MAEHPIDVILGYHAHVYYDASTKPVAARLRRAVENRFAGAVQVGRWHDRPVGPHLFASFQVAFPPVLFAEIVPWLALNRGGLTVFVHPRTGDAVRDHLDHAIWLGAKEELDVEALRDTGSDVGSPAGPRHGNPS